MNFVAFPTICMMIIITSLTLCIQNINGLGCTTFGDVRYRKVFRCRSEMNILINLTDITNHHCTHRCITLQGCLLVNYNVEERYCSLSNMQCLEYIADDGFVLAYFGSKEALCIKRVSYTLYEDTKAIVSQTCDSKPWLATCMLGRLVSPNSYAPPGKFFKSSQRVWSVLDGKLTKRGTKEILNIQDGCGFTWVSYTAGDTIPTCAVVGGYLALRWRHWSLRYTRSRPGLRHIWVLQPGKCTGLCSASCGKFFNIYGNASPDLVYANRWFPKYLFVFSGTQWEACLTVWYQSRIRNDLSILFLGSQPPFNRVRLEQVETALASIFWSYASVWIEAI